mmetsp:Transcript_3108/g.7174  ORF Transcript_3108/g.7174 Transcript_3108/m.7174 type:complete len:308 (-) Transcript_3108:3-926(-)
MRLLTEPGSSAPVNGAAFVRLESLSRSGKVTGWLGKDLNILASVCGRFCALGGLRGTRGDSQELSVLATIVLPPRPASLTFLSMADRCLRKGMVASKADCVTQRSEDCGRKLSCLLLHMKHPRGAKLTAKLPVVDISCPMRNVMAARACCTMSLPISKTLATAETECFTRGQSSFSTAKLETSKPCRQKNSATGAKATCEGSALKKPKVPKPGQNMRLPPSISLEIESAVLSQMRNTSSGPFSGCPTACATLLEQSYARCFAPRSASASVKSSLDLGDGDGLSSSARAVTSLLGLRPSLSRSCDTWD